MRSPGASVSSTTNGVEALVLPTLWEYRDFTVSERLRNPWEHETPTECETAADERALPEPSLCAKCFTTVVSFKPHNHPVTDPSLHKNKKMVSFAQSQMVRQVPNSRPRVNSEAQPAFGASCM